MKNIIIGLVIIALIGGVYLVTKDEKESPALSGSQEVRHLTFLNATTTTATSTASSADLTSITGEARISGAKRITFYFQRGDTTGQGNTGTSTFSVDASRNGTDWFTYNKLIDNVVNSNSQQLTRVAHVTFSAAANYDNATGTKMYTMDLQHDLIEYIRCGVVEVTDGEHSCFADVIY